MTKRAASSRLTYAVARADHEYLWGTYGPASDMTGGYVEEDDLARLLRTPTRATARDCYATQIAHWFHLGPETDVGDGWRTDPRVREIAARHLCEEGLARLLEMRVRARWRAGGVDDLGRYTTED